MNIQHSSNRREKGYIVVLTMIMLGLSLLMLAAMLDWTASSCRNDARNNEYYQTAAAAEAATEKVLVHMDHDGKANGDAGLYSTMNSGAYSSMYPSSTDDVYWASYSFTKPTDGSSGIWVGRIQQLTNMPLTGQYAGLNGSRATYRIASVAQQNNSRWGVKACVWQDIGLDEIPLFQFAIFYNMNLEIEPGVNMGVTGRVHGNTNIYLFPGSSVTLGFSNDVTASSSIIYNYMTNVDTHHSGTIGTVSTAPGVQMDSGVSSLNLPIGTNNSATNVYAVLQIPPSGESPTSAMGTNRYYNLADVDIVVSNSGVYVHSGYFLDNFGTTITDWTNFLTMTNAGSPIWFYNGREQYTNMVTQFDVAKFKTWAENASNPLKTLFPAGQTAAATVYIADFRSTNYPTYSTNPVSHVITTNILPVELGVRLINGTNLPVNGLTVASPDPVFILGDYNTTTNNVNFSSNTNSTVNTRPASVLGDAVTILSKNWHDNWGTNSLDQPVTGDTTINTAIVSGIVPTTAASYSGGVENFPRMLEDWSGHNLWYNGSMVVLFDSQIATGPWTGTGGYYKPPTRKWAFDVNFNDPTKLPPHTPMLWFLTRVHWAFASPTADPTQVITW